MNAGRLSTVLLYIVAAVLSLYMTSAQQAFEVLLSIGAGTAMSVPPPPCTTATTSSSSSNTCSPATAESLGIIKRLLHRGFVLLPEGEHANVIGFTPPLTISQRDLRRAVAALADEVAALP